MHTETVTPAYRLLLVLMFVLVIVSQTFGQSPKLSRTVTSNDAKGHYSIFWNLTTKEANGESLELIRRNRFEYSTFNIGGGAGIIAEKIIAKGKYTIVVDTVVLEIKKNTLPKKEFLSLKTKYLIRKIEADNKIFISLLPISKADYLQSIINNIPKEIEKSLWIEKIFTKEIKPL
jgi:hypothetical protein